LRRRRGSGRSTGDDSPLLTVVGVIQREEVYLVARRRSLETRTSPGNQKRRKMKKSVKVVGVARCPVEMKRLLGKRRQG
jgi:hypothetical protein